MKKIIIEIAATFGVVTFLLFSGVMIKNNVLAVNVYRVTGTQLEDTVICSGKIEYTETNDVSPAANGIVQEVFVEKGDTVEKGDRLFSMIANISAENVKGADTASLVNVVNNNSMNVEAPVSGTVLSVDIKSEDPIASGTTVITIVNSDNLCVNVPINENKISKIKTGQPVKITGTAFGNHSYSGKVSSIDSIAKQVVTTTGKETAVDVTVSIENPNQLIKQGYTAKCTITTNTKNNGIIIPYETVEMDSENSGTVYTFNNGKAQKKSVKIGNEYENGVEIISGLNKNDLVIEAPEKINDTGSVRVNKLLEIKK
ncbi:efflux RND transporter periplasmic adaptor subunit [Oscillospiraceae bacterium LCP25S3_E10]|nr:HlyD family efflux transporter periplasmic adaptor subunit [Ruminococcus sp.]MDD6447278.1 HlyD family efflux transporter periplasmic adaptor subunit [Ruminococcus sp.]MDY2855682.1 HlyD family efflux transporter periplasmic adaptor subunit [Oscillospiraceae bacterium]